MAKKKESKQKKMNVRVDFTPMVDMMMLLITFFMLCTSLAKPQAMHLTMPAKDQNLQAEDKDKSKTELTVTLYLAEDNKLYCYIIDKKEKFGDPEYLEELTWGKGKNGLRSRLTKYNPYRASETPIQALVNARNQLDAWYNAQPKAQKELSDSIYDRAMTMIKKGHLDIVKSNQLQKARYEEVDRQMKDGTENPNDLSPTLSVNIKPLDNSTYDNLVTVLDEMQICCIGKYVISAINDKDLDLLSKKGIVEAPAATAAAQPAQ